MGRIASREARGVDAGVKLDGAGVTTLVLGLAEPVILPHNLVERNHFVRIASAAVVPD